MKAPILLAFLGLATAQAAEPTGTPQPVPLTCAGKMTAARKNVTEDYTIAITVDVHAKTVTVGSYGTVPIVGDPDGDTIVFMVEKNSMAQVSTGNLNRITGVTSVHIITLIDGLYRFYGICKPAQKLF